MLQVAIYVEDTVARMHQFVVAAAGHTGEDGRRAVRFTVKRQDTRTETSVRG